MPQFPSQSVHHGVVPVIGTIIVIQLTSNQVNWAVMMMSIPPVTPFAEMMSIGAFPCMGTSVTGPFITSYLPVVSAPPHTVLLDVALLTTHPADRCLLLVRR